MASVTDVIRNYANKTPKKSGPDKGGLDWSTTNGNVHNIGDTLYSYGRHFPLAVRIGQRDGKDLFVLNGDRYSHQTSGHQSETRAFCKGPILAFSAFDRMGFTPGSLKPEDIIDYSDGRSQYVARHKVTGEWREWNIFNGKGDNRLGFPWTPPNQGSFTAHTFKDNDWKLPEGETVESWTAEWTYGEWHTLGGVLFRHPYDSSRFFLSGLDEGSYFISELPRAAVNIPDAMNALKPQEVLDAEGKGLAVIRQGEWFFVATEHKDTEKEMVKGFEKAGWPLVSLGKQVALPPQPNPENFHVCQRMITLGFGNNKKIIVRGSVTHKSMRGAWTRTKDPQDSVWDTKLRVTGEHRTVRLGDTWHYAYRNTELAAHKAGAGRGGRGRVD